MADQKRTWTSARANFVEYLRLDAELSELGERICELTRKSTVASTVTKVSEERANELEGKMLNLQIEMEKTFPSLGAAKGFYAEVRATKKKFAEAEEEATRNRQSSERIAAELADAKTLEERQKTQVEAAERQVKSNAAAGFVFYDEEGDDDF